MSYRIITQINNYVPCTEDCKNYNQAASLFREFRDNNKYVTFAAIVNPEGKAVACFGTLKAFWPDNDPACYATLTSET